MVTATRPLTLPHYRFTESDLRKMVAAGIFTEDDRIELIEGVVVPMSPIGAEHVGSVNSLNDLLTDLARRDAVVSVQNPVRLPDGSMPQPDVVLIRRPTYRATIPSAEDVLVVIEVADSSLAYDREVKLPLYAAAGIPEAWIVDLGAQRIERHTQPGPGGYNAMLRFGRGETVPSTIIASLAIPVDGALGIAQ